jgi:hypothetical protein
MLRELSRLAKQIRHGGQEYILHPACADRYLAALADPPGCASGQPAVALPDRV